MKDNIIALLIAIPLFMLVLCLTWERHRIRHPEAARTPISFLSDHKPRKLSVSEIIIGSTATAAIVGMTLILSWKQCRAKSPCRPEIIPLIKFFFVIYLFWMAVYLKSKPPNQLNKLKTENSVVK